MTLPLPDPLVSRHADAPLQGEDVGQRLSPWGVQRNFEAVAQRFPLGPDDLHFGGTVTALPSGVDEGFEVNYLLDSTNDVLHRFKYMPSLDATYPWISLGETCLFAEVTTAQATSSNAYGALATAGPTVTAPLAGKYRYRFGANVEASLLAGWRGRVSVTGADATSAWAAGGGNAAIAVGASVCRVLEGTLTAGATPTLTYRSDASNSVTFANRFIELTPLKVA